MPKRNGSDSVRFVDSVPARGTGGKWADKLMPLVQHKGRYALVAEMGSPVQAQELQNNLSQRKVLIPHPTHEWWFGARGCEVYARYIGPIRATRKK